MSFDQEVKDLKDRESRLPLDFPVPDNAQLFKEDEQPEHKKRRFGFKSRIALYSGINILVSALFQLPDVPSAGSEANLFAITAVVNLIEGYDIFNSMERDQNVRQALSNGLLTCAPLATSLLTNLALN